eukprot:UN24361
MGAYMNRHYFNKFWDNHQKRDWAKIKDAISVFADPETSRTYDTGISFLEGFMDGMPQMYHPVINSDLSPSDVSSLLRDYASDSQRAVGCDLGDTDQVMGLIGNNTDNLLRLHKQQFDTLQDIIGVVILRCVDTLQTQLNRVR